MIIACPACSTRYVVPDKAIGVEGRTVRCAKCRHSWHQEGAELDLAAFEKTPEQPASAPPSAPAEEPAPKPGFTDAHGAAPDAREVSPPAPPPVSPPPPPPPAPPPLPTEQDREPIADERFEETVDEFPAPPPTVVETAPDEDDAEEFFDEESRFDYEPPFKPRRNLLKVWTIAGGLFAAIAIGTVAAVSYYGLPDWVPISRPTFAVGQADLVLEFPADQQDRRTLPNGSEFFSASGTITNVGRETQQVPSILIVMRDERDRVVYSWEVVPPEPRLAPGGEMTINEVVTDVPKSAKFAEIGWKPG